MTPVTSLIVHFVIHIVQAALFFHRLNYGPLDVHWKSTTSSLVLPALFSALPVAAIGDEAKECRVVRELLQVAVRWFVHAVCSVEGEEDGSQNCSCGACWPPDKQVKLTVQIHRCGLQLAPQKRGLYSIKGAGEIKNPDSHSALSLFRVREEFVEEADDRVEPRRDYVAGIASCFAAADWGNY